MIALVSLVFETLKFKIKVFFIAVNALSYTKLVHKHAINHSPLDPVCRPSKLLSVTTGAPLP